MRATRQRGVRPASHRPPPRPQPRPVSPGTPRLAPGAGPRGTGRQRPVQRSPPGWTGTRHLPRVGGKRGRGQEAEKGGERHWKWPWGRGRLEGQAPCEGPADPEVKDTRGSGPLPLQRLARGGAHRARAEAAGDPEWATEGARVAVCVPGSVVCSVGTGRFALSPLHREPLLVRRRAGSGRDLAASSQRRRGREKERAGTFAASRAARRERLLGRARQASYLRCLCPCARKRSLGRRSGRPWGGYRSGALSFEQNRC